jgi:hydroxymethylpyrimidine pyrophosphatase-like HAD family hydrolase
MFAYKAVIFDIDGTAIPANLDAIPSSQLIRAIKEAQRRVKVCAATGRSLPHVSKLLHILSLKDPCILSGGTQIVDPRTEKTLWEKRLSKAQVKEVIILCLPYPYEVGFSDEAKGAPAENKVVRGSERIMYIGAVTREDAEILKEKLQQIAGVTAHIGSSWTKDRVDIHVTNRYATKKFAVEKLLKLLGVDKDTVIGVGDTDNDLPLFESVGFKIAMANGTEKLKRSADYIAPSVDEDGLAFIIDMFLNKGK